VAGSWRDFATCEALCPGSVTKGLTGMRFVKLKVPNDGPFEERLSGLRTWMLCDAARLSEPQIAAKFLNDPTNAYRFDQTTVEHLLRHETGWDQNYDWTGKADALADHVPLDAGDAVPVLRYQTDTLYVADPGVKKNDYSNPAFWLLGEILSLEVTDGASAAQYRPIMRAFWKHADNEDFSASVVIPFERDESFTMGLIPLITSFPAASPRPVPGDAENVASYPWRSNAWCEPHGLVLAGGHWAMSMKNLARIFEGMAPTPGPFAPKLLEPWQVEVLAGRPLAGLQAIATWGMGMPAWRYTAPDTSSGAGAATYDVLGLGGGVTAGGCYAAQFRLRSGEGPGTITIAIAATTDFPSATLERLYAVLNIVRAINHLAYWDGAPDLFA